MHPGFRRRAVRGRLFVAKWHRYSGLTPLAEPIAALDGYRRCSAFLLLPLAYYDHRALSLPPDYRERVLRQDEALAD
jgi:hypothetical protein